MTGHLLLVDCSAFAYRAFHTANPIYRESDGQPIGAVISYMSMMWRMLGAAEADKPTHGAAVFDTPGPTFRHKLWPKYKANRPAARHEELDGQFQWMRHASEALGLTPVEKAGYEADDLIATLATSAARAGIRSTIVSSDKDFGQLVRDGMIEIVDPMTKRRVLEADVKRRWGVEASRVAHVQAIAGDPVDNIPGVSGIGLRAAAALVRQYDTVEGVIANAKHCRLGSQRAMLRRHADELRIFLKLTTLRRNVRHGRSIAEFELQPVLESHLREIVRVLGADKRYETIFSNDPKVTRVVDAIDGDPLAWWKEEIAAPGQPIPAIPQCGYYERRFVKLGPFVPCSIWREAHHDSLTGEPTGKQVLLCSVDGKPADPWREWDRLPRHPIKIDRFSYLTADTAHAKQWRPGDPKATPHEPIDLASTPVPHCPKPLHPRRRALRK